MELDDRMNDEAKNFMKNQKPTNLLKNIETLTLYDIKSIRKDYLNEKLVEIEKHKIENLETEEILIKSKYDDHMIEVTCYKPKDVKPNSPITMFMHGGGWTFGCREGSHISVGRLASNSKTIWLSVEYRLCPEVKFPVPLNDCLSVFEWIAENKSKFGSSDDAKLGVCGDSAGGHLAALVTHNLSHLVNYQILVYPILDLSVEHNSEKEFVKECFGPTPPIRNYFRKSFFDDDQHLAFSPSLSPLLKENFSNLPQTLIVACELDPLVDHSIAYHNKLNESNVKSELVIIKGAIHGFLVEPISMKNANKQLNDLIFQLLENF